MSEPIEHVPGDCDGPVGTGPPPYLARAVAAVQRRAFVAFLDHTDQPRLADLAEAASREATGVAQAIAWLESRGRLERDGDHLVGAHGLTTRPTRHALTIGDRRLHTWCAYDAVAIPVALGATAHAETTCPTCGRRLSVDIHAGVLPAGERSVLWLPTGPCGHVIKDFCAHANLFCDADHLDTWRAAAGQPVGCALPLDDVPELARSDWADIARA